MSHRADFALLVAVATSACAPAGTTPSAFVGPQPTTAQPGSPGPTAPTGPTGPAMPPAAGGDVGRYVYAIPPGWTEQRGEGFITLTGPDCAFHLIAPFAAQGSLEATLDAAWAQYFAGHQSINATAFDTVATGTSAAGWRYRRLEAQLGSTTNPGQTFNALGFAAELGGEVAIVFGISSLGGRCFLDRWGLFFDGLAFAGLAERDDAFRDALVGTWMSASAAAGSSVTFAGNGRYDWVGLHERDSRISDTHVLRTTTTFQGDGAWTLRGRHLVMKSDRGDETTARIRIETEETRQGRAEVLCQIKRDAGGEYESCMRR